MQRQHASTPDQAKPPPDRTDQYEAEWSTPLPSSCEPQHIFPLIQSMLIVGFSWDRFIWKLSELLRLLTERPAEFNYLYVVRLLRARAAYLAGGGPFSLCNATEIREGIAAGRVEFVSIYIRLFVQYLEEAIAKGYGDGRDELFRLARIEMESTFLTVLEACCLDPENDEVFRGIDVKSWATGTGPAVNGRRVSAMPAAVQIPVRVAATRGKRRVRPGKQECVRKLGKDQVCYWFEERIGRAIPTDLALERLCSQPLVEGCRTVRYGDMCFGYFETQTNDEKTTLYVLCSDRMLKLETANGMMPGSHPTEIEHVFFESIHESMYLVHFDDGEFGLFRLSFRAHTYVDRERLPEAARRSRGTSASGSHALASGGAHIPLPVASQSPSIAGLLTRGSRDGQPAGDSLGSEQETDLPSANTEVPRKEKKRDACEGEPEVKIARDYKVIQIGGERIVFGRKYKRRRFVRFLHERKKKTGEDTFYVEEMKEEFGAVTGDPIRSERFEEDLFKDQSREFHLMFEEVDRASGLYRLKL